jgi:hypothetical protein
MEVQDFPENLRNPRNLGTGQSRSMLQVRDFAIDLFQSAFRILEIRPTPFQTLSDFSNSFYFFKIRIFASASCVCHSCPKNRRWQSRLLSLMPTILHERIRN